MSQEAECQCNACLVAKAVDWKELRRKPRVIGADFDPRRLGDKRG